MIQSNPSGKWGTEKERDLHTFMREKPVIIRTGINLQDASPSWMIFYFYKEINNKALHLSSRTINSYRTDFIIQIFSQD